MNEIEYRAERARYWRQLLDEFDVKMQWDWCLYVGLCETASWTNRDNEHRMFSWSK